MGCKRLKPFERFKRIGVNLGLQCSSTKAQNFLDFTKLKICKVFLWRPKAKIRFSLVVV